MQKPLASFPILLVLAGIYLVATNLAGTANMLISCCSVSSGDLIYVLLTGSCLAIAWILIYRPLKVSPASYLTMMSMLTPVIVSILAILFLGESLTWIQVIGAGLIILSGIVIYFSDMAYV